MIEKIGKEHIGQNIYGVSRGNNSLDGVEIAKFKVITVNSVYSDLGKYPNINIRTSYDVGSYDSRTGITVCQKKAGHDRDVGYIFFDTLKEAQEEISRQEMVSELLENSNEFKKFPYEAIKEIHTVFKEQCFLNSVKSK